MDSFAPNTFQVLSTDSGSDCLKAQILDASTLSVIARSVRGSLWANHIILTAIVLTEQRWAEWQILQHITLLHGYFLELSRTHGLASMASWDIQGCYEDDLWSGRLDSRERDRRILFWESYRSVVGALQHWLAQLSEPDRRKYERFVLPPLS